jgi:hypothetical protein
MLCWDLNFETTTQPLPSLFAPHLRFMQTRAIPSTQSLLPTEGQQSEVITHNQCCELTANIPDNLTRYHAANLRPLDCKHQTWNKYDKMGLLTFLLILIYVPVEAVMEGSSCVGAAFWAGAGAVSTTTWLLLELLLRLWLPESRLLLRTPVTAVFSSRGWYISS